MRRNESVSIAADERGYVPFAVIGVFLLVTSVSVNLETRIEPEGDTDAARSTP